VWPDVAANDSGAQISGQFESLVQRDGALGSVGNWYEKHSHIEDSLS
jgi:hypothetical protein